MLGQHVATILSFSATALLLNMGGAAALGDCSRGLVPVYWQESVGAANETWRDTYVFETGLEPPNLSLVLHYDPVKDTAEWLNGHVSGTNVVIWDLVPLDGTGDTLPFRWVKIVADEISPSTVRGKAVTALIVNMKIYWPVCAKAETVEAWKTMAGPPG